MINLASIVGEAFAIGRSLIPTAFPAVTLRLCPTSVVDPVADTATTTWAVTVTALQPIAYSAEQERENAPVEKSLRSFGFNYAEVIQGIITVLLNDGGAPLLDGSGQPLQNDAPTAVSLLDQTAEIFDGEKNWQVYRVEADPSGSFIIFHAAR